MTKESTEDHVEQNLDTEHLTTIIGCRTAAPGPAGSNTDAVPLDCWLWGIRRPQVYIVARLLYVDQPVVC